MNARMKKIFCRLLAVLLCQGALFAGTPPGEEPSWYLPGCRFPMLKTG